MVHLAHVVSCLLPNLFDLRNWNNADWGPVCLSWLTWLHVLGCTEEVHEFLLSDVWHHTSYSLSLSLSLSLSGYPRRQTTQPLVSTYQGKLDSHACIADRSLKIYASYFMDDLCPISWLTWENASTWLESMALGRPQAAPCFMHMSGVMTHYPKL